MTAMVSSSIGARPAVLTHVKRGAPRLGKVEPP